MYNVRIPLRLGCLAYRASRVHSNPGRNVETSLSQRRCLHQLLDLPYSIEHGLGDFLSPAALHMIAIDYQQGLLTRLNEQVKGTEMENQSVTQTVISAASNRRHALAFNYASQALNNSFFLHNLTPPPPPPETNDPSLGSFVEDVRLNFGSLAQLKSTFSAAAMGMINSGWVWLVSDERGSMQVVATFGAGTLLVRSRRHMLEDEKKPILGENPALFYGAGRSTMPSPSPRTQQTQPTTSPSSGLHKTVPRPSPSMPTRELHVSATRQVNLHRGPHMYDGSSSLSASGRSSAGFDDIGDILTPLLCVSVHEHAWVGAGYGVWGKEEYLKRFWTVVNWSAVERAFSKALQYA